MLGVFYWQNYFETANFSATATYACWATDEQPVDESGQFHRGGEVKTLRQCRNTRRFPLECMKGRFGCKCLFPGRLGSGFRRHR